MTTGADPHRVLGVPRGASAAEIKRAYRALAKLHHPDAAGHSSLPRFLEIQAAYEALIGSPAPGGRAGRPGATGATGATGAAGARARRPAQPGSSRDPAGEGTGGSATGAADDPWTSGAWARRETGSTRGADPKGSTGSSAKASAAGDQQREHARPRPERPDRPGQAPKATLGSTTYDGADPLADAHWDGASWYGASSGEYWTINPREYADPRKHGPEYQERARRLGRHRIHGRPNGRPASAPAPAAASAPPAAPAPTSGPAPAPSPTPASPRAAASPLPAPQPGPAPAPMPEPGDSRRPATPNATVPTPGRGPGPGATLPAAGARFGLAVIGWLPIGAAVLVMAGLPGSLILTLPIHAAGILVLFRAPRVAWATAVGLVGAVAGLVLGAAIASVLGMRAAGGGIPVGFEAIPALAGGVLATWLADWGRFGPPPWERQ